MIYVLVSVREFVKVHLDYFVAMSVNWTSVGGDSGYVEYLWFPS
jgi:hypothetical protein